MLLPQIPAGRKQTIAAELGFNVALLSGNIRAETTTLDNRVTRLLAVEKYIRTNESLGSPSDPQTWVEGSHLSGHSVYLEGGALLWVCKGHNWLLLLAGSAKHVAGAAPIQEAHAPFSELAGIMTLVSRSAPDALRHFDGSEAWPRETGMREDFIWLRNLIDYVIDTCRSRPQPSQDISFVARRLICGYQGDERLVLASPLYVELPS